MEERDFMGLKPLNFIGDTIVIEGKEAEEVELSKDSGLSKTSGVPWTSASKVSARPHFTSYKADHHAGSSTFMAMSSADAYDLNNKRLSSELQPHDVTMPPYSPANPFLSTQFSGAGQNFGGSTMKQRASATTPQSVLGSNSFMAGTTDPRFNSKSAGAPVPLTIFYAGKVYIYDDISPEKAQTIMYLAGNDISKIAPPKVATGEAAYMFKMMNNTPPQGPQPCSARSRSSISVSSHPMGQTSVISIANNDETNMSTAKRISNALLARMDSAVIMTSPIPALPTTALPSGEAVPQARKASLTRFLEKRKDRVTSVSPYSHNENPPLKKTTTGTKYTW